MSHQATTPPMSECSGSVDIRGTEDSDTQWLVVVVWSRSRLRVIVLPVGVVLLRHVTDQTEQGLCLSKHSLRFTVCCSHNKLLSTQKHSSCFQQTEGLTLMSELMLHITSVTGRQLTTRYNTYLMRFYLL